MAKGFMEQFRRAVAESGVSRYAIWRATGIDQGTLSRFAGGKGLSMEAIDAIAGFLDLHVVAKKVKGKKVKHGGHRK